MATDEAVVSPDDIAFLHRFEGCGVTEEEWTHEAHVRLAWIVLSLEEFPTACARLRDGILRHNTYVLGRPEQYHETVTVAFAAIINDRRRPGEHWAGFRQRIDDILSAKHPILFDYYSAGRLGSDAARAAFVEPDVRPLPGKG